MPRIKVVLLFAFALLAGVYCRSRKQAEPQPARTKAGVTRMPAEALRVMTDPEVAKFVTAIPVAASAVRAAGYAAPSIAEDEPIGAVITKLADGLKDVPGMNDALVKAGTNWKEFRGTLMRVMAASAALTADELTRVADGRAGDTSAQARAMLRQVDAYRIACAAVPAENKKLAEKYAGELFALQLLTP